MKFLEQAMSDQAIIEFLMFDFCEICQVWHAKWISQRISSRQKLIFLFRRMSCELLCWSPSWWHSSATVASPNSRGGPSTTDSPTSFSFLQTILGSTMSLGTTQPCRSYLWREIVVFLDIYETPKPSLISTMVLKTACFRPQRWPALQRRASSWSRITSSRSVPQVGPHSWQVIPRIHHTLSCHLGPKFSPN